MHEDVRAPNYELAENDYMNGMKYKEIAEKYSVTINTVKSWKTRYGWSKDGKKGVHTKSQKVCTQKGGQRGNKNAFGHGAPKQNKNALKTGEFETLFFDALSEEEKQLIELIEPDKEKLLLQEIQLLTIRERRMMRRIEDLKMAENLEAENEDQKNEEYGLRKKQPGMTITKYTFGIEKGKNTDLKEYEGILGQIQAIEDALTRVQARRQRAIETLHRFGYDDSILELEIMKFEYEMLKADGSGEEAGDDGFLEALNASAREAWSDD